MGTISEAAEVEELRVKLAAAEVRIAKLERIVERQGVALSMIGTCSNAALEPLRELCAVAQHRAS